MKKIIVSISFLALLLVIACDTASKSSVSTNAAQSASAQEAGKPKKGEMKESDMKAVPDVQQHEKKALPQKGKLKPMEAVIEADSVVPKHG